MVGSEMELGLSLGAAAAAEAPARPFFVAAEKDNMGLGLGFSMGLGVGFGSREEEKEEGGGEEEEGEERGSADQSVQLTLLPLVPVPRHPSCPQLGFSWPIENTNLEASTRGFDVNRTPVADEAEEAAAAASSSPNSTVSSFQMDFFDHCSGDRAPDAGRGSSEGEAERASSRASDEEENGMPRKF